MTPERNSRPRTLLILGASGDLTQRLLLPGLASLVASEVPADRDMVAGLRIVGSGRSERSRADWQKQVNAALAEAGVRAADARALVAAADYVVADPTSKADLNRIIEGVRAGLIIYFALPPAIVLTVADTLSKLSAEATKVLDTAVLAVEKPFGSDSRSAATLNRRLLRVVPEEQIHRVDHFLGMATVLNLVGLRFVNRLVEPVWNADNVEKVEIVYDEDLGLEGRAGYYDTSGALVDMLQSHLLQVLSIVAMEAPASIDPVDFRAATAQVLRATEVWSGPPVLPGTSLPSRRARYTAGTVDGDARSGDSGSGDSRSADPRSGDSGSGEKGRGRSMPAYAKEKGVDPSRETETLAELVVEVNTRRWAGVPFVLRSGKAIGVPRKEIILTLKPVGFVPRGLTGTERPERIVVGLKPSSVTLELTMNGDGDPFGLDRHDLSATLDAAPITAYGEVMRGVLGGDPTLSIRGDVAETCWRIVAPVLNSWRRNEVPLEEYRAGSEGPAAWRRDITPR
ncbi:glucose-6-phosphate dehydrogenase [Subtercola frigoramans]|uniref:Glucose-6-phosphate 1-dehydrogenase n=1 Tax=Subtercola frigoramans TaxID=120298 RepID=A0ABS2L6S6_9MICO|nr:glucose-6-phosphate dehydrogenase (NADP(+)) [Subtercola frigoramans]MBM7472430.1 glucose-6-phosphate 1-dehydrogenase [Subtercola frigoramans]